MIFREFRGHKIPMACSKGELYRFLNKFNTESVRSDINEVIVEHRNITLDLAKNVKTLFKPEVEKVLKIYGEI